MQVFEGKASGRRAAPKLPSMTAPLYRLIVS
jgi:hypothetical protein